MRPRVIRLLSGGPTILATLALFAGIAGGTGTTTPTCSTLGFKVHGEHVVTDYVAGSEHAELGWPPSGAVLGSTVAANGGAAVPGGPGPGFHFPNGLAPGASFCNGSKSPGTHL